MENSDSNFIESFSNFFQKADQDITTIQNLSGLTTLVVSGGYAVEAHCGGLITRSHGDIDLVAYPKPNEAGELESKFREKLFKEDTPWQQTTSTMEKIEFRELDKSKKFIERRRVEILLFEDNKPEKRFVTKTLVNSNGNTYEVKVVPIEDLVAQKIKIIHEKSNDPKRPTNLNDLLDLNRLLSRMSQLEKDSAFQILVRRLMRNGFDQEQSHHQASTLWNDALTKIKTS